MRIDCDEAGIELAYKAVVEGKVIIFPTDTIYGIGCDPYNWDAVKKIYKIKSREESKLLPVLAYSKDLASTVANLDKDAEKLADRFWPGPLTIIIKVTDQTLKRNLNLGEKIALRVPNNNCALSLLSRCRFLVGTSANVSGQKPYNNPSECYQNMSGFDLFLDGGNVSGVQSTIVEIDNCRIEIRREGSLAREEIMSAL